MSFFAGATLGGRLASLDALGLIWQASWIVQLVLALLVLLSVLSWAIIFVKWRELGRARQDSEAFLEVYQEGSFDAAYQVARDLDRSPVASVFLAGYGELHRMLRLSDKQSRAGISEAQARVLTRQIAWVASATCPRPRASRKADKSTGGPYLMRTRCLKKNGFTMESRNFTPEMCTGMTGAAVRRASSAAPSCSSPMEPGPGIRP